MDIRAIRITKREVDAILASAAPAAPASVAGDACAVFRRNRHYLQVAIALLSIWHPPGAAAVAALTAIVEKACEDGGGEKK